MDSIIDNFDGFLTNGLQDFARWWDFAIAAIQHRPMTSAIVAACVFSLWLFRQK